MFRVPTLDTEHERSKPLLVFTTQVRAVTTAWPGPSAPTLGRLRDQGIAGVGVRTVTASDSTTQKALCQGERNNNNGMERFGCRGLAGRPSELEEELRIIMRPSGTYLVAGWALEPIPSPPLLGQVPLRFSFLFHSRGNKNNT